MRITKELFDKLNKKDREEFIVRRTELLERMNPFSLTLMFICITAIILVTAMIVLPLWKLAFPEYIFISIGKLFVVLITSMKLAIFLTIIIDLLFILYYFDKIENLKKEYFNIEIKIKSRRK